MMGGVLSRSGAAFLCAMVLLNSPAQSDDAGSGSVHSAVRHQGSIPAETDEPAAAVREPPSAADVDAYLDDFMPDALARSAIPCAVVVVVSGGRVLAERGFGLADVSAGLSCEADRTVFRIASLSKLFVWTAVMQLVERGQLDLDRDINTWLDFSIRPAFDAPVTLRSLMTHTAGFEEAFRDFIYADARQLGSQQRFFHTVQPARIFPPGERVAYSNYGAALAAYIVERVAGEPFEDYVARHIFEPLRMRDSTFRQPPPAELLGRRAQSYSTSADPPEAPLYTQPIGAGAAVSTGADMARFMLAHLQDGALDGARILSVESARTMREMAWQPDVAVRLNSMALGFERTDYNGWAVVRHGGDTQGFRSLLSMIPDAGLGVFIAVNGSGTDNASWPLRNELAAGIFDLFLPAPAPLPQEPTAPTAVMHAREVTGAYLSTRRVESGLMKFGVHRHPVHVLADEHGVLTVSSLRDFDDELKRWREVGPYVWRQVGGRERLAAAHDASGKLSYLAADATPTRLLEPAPWFRRADWLYRILQVAVGALAVGALVLAIGPRVRRWRVAVFAAVANVAFVAACVALTNAFETYYYHFNETIDPWFRLLQAVGLAALLATLVTAFRVMRAWSTAGIALPERVAASVIAAAGLYVGWFAFAFNFFSIRLQ